MNRLLDRLIARIIQRGRLDIDWSDGTTTHYGSGDGHVAHLRFRDAGAEWAVLRNPELAVGEAYMNGRIDFPGDTLLDFLLLVNDNWDAFRKIPFVAGLARLRFLGRRAAQ